MVGRKHIAQRFPATDQSGADASSYRRRTQQGERNSQKENTVGIIKSGLFISLDGVVESPNSWHFPYFNDEMGAAVGAMMAGNDALLIGRKTYEEFASYWPTADRDDPITAQMNGTRKYVVSTTLTDPTWENSTVVSGDVKAEIAKLKQDQQLGTTGSGTLVRWLLQQGLLDELHLLVHPLVVGEGKKLFDDGTRVPLQLLSSTTFSTGVLHLVYARAAE
jgi:dihydrofolate reductase